MALYDFRIIGSFTLTAIGGDVAPSKIAEANPLRRGLYLVSYTADFFIAEDGSPADAQRCFRVPGGATPRVFKVGTEPVTDTGQIYAYGNGAGVVLFAAELVEVTTTAP